MSKKAVLRTAQDIFVLDKAFFLIEGHPSREQGFVLCSNHCANDEL